MYYLLLEIGSYQQLARLNAAVLERLLIGVENIASQYAGSKLYEEGGRILYRFSESDSGEALSVAHAAVEIREALAEQRDELAGYSLVVDYVQAGTASEVMEGLHRTLIRVPEDENAWIGEHAVAAFEPFVRTTGENGPRKLLGLDQEHSEQLGDVRAFAMDEHAVEAILDELEPWVNGEDAPGTLCVRGDALSGLRYTVEAALSKLQGERKSWIVVRGSVSADEPVAPLAAGLDTVMLHQASHYLNAVEREVWDERQSLLEQVSQGRPPGLYDALETDFMQGYQLYLTAFCRRLVSERKTPVILIEDLQGLSAHASELLTHVLLQLRPELAPVVVASSDFRAHVPGLGGRARKDLTVEPLSLERFLERVDGALSEAAKRQVRLREGYGRTHGRLLTVYHYLVNIQQGNHGESVDIDQSLPQEHQEAARLIGSLAERDRELLLVCGLWSRIAPNRYLIDALVAVGFERVRLTDSSKRLVQLGLLRDEEWWRPTAPEFARIAAMTLGSRAKALRDQIYGWVVGALRDGVLAFQEATLGELEAYGNRVDVLRLYHGLIHHLLDRRELQRVYALLYRQLPFASTRLQAAESELQNEIVDVGRIRLGLLRGAPDEAGRVSGRHRSGGSRLAGDVPLHRGRNAFAHGNGEEAITLVKRASIVFQEREDHAGVDRASTDFGVYALAGDRIGDARDYFVMGRSSRTRRAYDRLRNALYRCVTLYLYGNLTRVLELSRNLADEAEYSGFREYQLFSGFLEARTQFELGRYEEASQRLEQLLTVASCYGRRDAMSTLRRWLARTEIYLGDAEGSIKALRGDLGGPETWLFLTEAHEHGEQYAEALECARTGLECSHPTVIRSTETALWQTGFAGIEDTVGRNRRIVYRLLDTLHAYLQALVASEREEALGELHRFTRSRRVGESDPYNPMYFYLYSALLRKGDPEAPDDKLTVLGKAVRFLQDRASRIDDYSDKVAFLHQNYWNRRLVDTARGENLFN